jgi:cytochrome c biogenesis protein CcmG/thiol:disulfide interchange protein DsbE
MTRHHRATGILLSATLASIAIAAPADPTAADPYRRVGTPDRIVQIRELETRPFDFEAFGALAEWAGDPVTRESLGDRLLVVLAWDQGDAKSVRLLPTLARLERSLRGKALCVAVHQRAGWAEARHAIDAGRVAIASAHDADGSFFETLKIDDHPNLFIVDRSGHVRIADLDPRDLNRAVLRLSRETPQQAEADLPRRVERLAEARAYTPADIAEAPADEPGREPRTTDDRPPVLRTVAKPDASAYAQASWPGRNTQGLSARDIQGQPLPALFGQETWLTEKPEGVLEDRVRIIDFWATWCGPCIRASPTLDQIQTQFADEVLVMGLSGQAAGARYPEDERSIREYIRSHPVSYAHLHDRSQRLFKNLAVKGIPHVMVISTDGVVRWQGNPLDPRFRLVVDQTVRADPYLDAKRAQSRRDP